MRWDFHLAFHFTICAELPHVLKWHSDGIHPGVALGNIDLANCYAYDANPGWIDFAPPITDSMIGGRYFLKGYAWSSN